jgi:glycine C-acetyltransferase
MNALEQALEATQSKRLRMIATDGVFSMDGFLAKLDVVCDLAEKYNAMVMVDDSHASGFIGKTGRGTPEHFGVAHRIDVMTSTLGKALGGAAGGFTTGKKEIVDLLRQRSRPYLFSNSIAPAIAGASIRVLDLLGRTTELRDRVMGNAKRFREGMTKAGFTIKEGIHPIVPVMLGDAKLSQDMSAQLLKEGIYVIGFFYPVVPKNEARIRVQLSADHTTEHVDRAVAAFTKVGRALGVIKA